MTFVVMDEKKLLPGYWTDGLTLDALATKEDAEGLMRRVQVLKAKQEAIQGAN